ncbi:unnamed protein product [Schistosoma bovis]|nr:unnamed protein product [Schistosoma bovis]CAH8638170.1 unnamed protein product [Schistosoma bovis]
MPEIVIANIENVKKVADHIQKMISIVPEIGIICGSGLGKLADGVKDKIIIPYTKIPNFPQTSVVGHSGNLIFGTLSGRKVVVMQGRFHMYEGYTNDKIALPIRVMKLLGVKILMVSNAAGGLNRSLKLGDFVILKDHIYLPGLGLNNVLVGPNHDEFGPRFPALSDAYNSDLRKLAMQVAVENGFGDSVHQGVYVMNGGPCYETPAECTMLLNMGCDVVGMSTIPEVVIARHCGIQVFAVSLVTNISVLDVESSVKANHEEVLAMGAQRAELMQSWFEKIIEKLPKD